MSKSFLEAIVIESVASTIHLYGPISGKDIAIITGCTDQSVNRVVASMLKTGAIVETGIKTKSGEPTYCEVSGTLGHKASST